MSQPTVYIDGDQGTTGLLIHERLRGRDDLQLVTLPDTERKDPCGAPKRSTQPTSRSCACPTRPRAAVGFIRNPAVRVIDASSAHRTQPDWVYGFPEMASGHDDCARTARHQSGLLSDRRDRATAAPATGRPAAARLPGEHPCRLRVLGRRRAAVDAFESNDASHAKPLQVYGLALAHKHVPEIQLHAGLTNRPMFVPAYGAYRQGIVLTVPIELRLLPAGVTGEQLHACLAHHYADARHVDVTPLAETRDHASRSASAERHE